MAGCERWHVRYLVSFVESELRTATATMPPFAITECRVARAGRIGDLLRT